MRLRRWVRVLLLLAALAFVWWMRASLHWPQVYFETDASMAPTVARGAYFVATGPVRELRRGMLVIFRYQDPSDDDVYHVLRRLAGLPGDTVAMHQGVVFVNGRATAWPFRVVAPKAWRSAMARGGNLFTFGPVRVPADSIFLLADTRDVAGWPDSRFVGPVPVKALEAEARRLLWPPGRGRFLKSLRD